MATKHLLIVGLCALATMWMSTGVFAHDGDLGDFDFADMGASAIQQADHYDVGPFKGYAEISVTNTSATNVWGDFHFGIVGATDVYFDFSPAAENNTIYDLPWSDNPGVTWTLALDKLSLDVEFYGDPVNPGETIDFILYTDNTESQNAWFGVSFWPTPVPEPATWVILVLGAGMLSMRRHRRA